MGDRLTKAELDALRERRWDAADARRVLRYWGTSGLSLCAFGARHRLAAQRLCWWRKRLGEWRDDDESTGGVSHRLVPAVVVGAPASAVAIAIKLPSGVALEVSDPAVVEPAWIAAVVGALSRPG